ncbi:MAG: hypothetical protein AB7E60_09465 [Sphingobium sp.]
MGVRRTAGRAGAHTREPTIGQMRLAWWEEVLTDAAGDKGRGDPLVDALRGTGAMTQEGVLPGLLSMLDGWEALLLMEESDQPALLRFAQARGGGLFAALARRDGEMKDSLSAAACLWALWDLSGHVGDARTRTDAITLAATFLRDTGRDEWPRACRSLRIAAALARHDIARGRAAESTLTPRVYGRLVRIALVGV